MDWSYRKPYICLSFNFWRQYPADRICLTSVNVQQYVTSLWLLWKSPVFLVLGGDCMTPRRLFQGVHNGSLSWLYICLHDTTTKCHAGASHLGVSSPRFLHRSENFTPVRNLATVLTGSPDVVCVNILIFTWTKWYESSKLAWTEIVQKSKYNKTKLRYL